MLRSMLFCLPNQLFQGPIHVLVPKAPDKRLQHGGSCLREALGKGDLLALAQHVCQHPWHDAMRKADVHKRQVREEEAHGGVEAGIPPWLR